MVERTTLKMNSVLNEIYNIGIVPVVTLERLSDAVPLATALQNGNIPCAEITFRTDCAKDAIREILSAYPTMLVGAGTVLTVEQAKDAVEAGAKFIVSPGFNPTVVKYCIENKIPVIPGVITPTEIETALSFGLNTLKFFPSEAFGGVKTIKALSAPYKDVRFMPTGGVNILNLMSYLSVPSVIACGGSWMVEKSLIESGNFAEIEKLSKEAINTVLGFDYDEILKDESENANIETNSILRAKYFLQNKGFDFSGDKLLGVNQNGFKIRLKIKE